MDGNRADSIVVSVYPPSKARLSEYSFKLVDGLAAKGLSTKVLSDVEPISPQKVKNLTVNQAWAFRRPRDLA